MRNHNQDLSIQQKNLPYLHQTEPSNMPKLLLIIAIAVGVHTLSFAQEGEDLFMLFDESIEAPPLLPERMVFIQRIFWGEKPTPAVFAAGILGIIGLSLMFWPELAEDSNKGVDLGSIGFAFLGISCYFVDAALNFPVERTVMQVMFAISAAFLVAPFSALKKEKEEKK